MEAVTCGGNASRFYAAVLLRLSRMRLIKTEDKVSSWSKHSEVFDLACEHGLIMKQELFLAKNRRVCDKLVMAMKDFIFENWLNLDIFPQTCPWMI